MSDHTPQDLGGHDPSRRGSEAGAEVAGVSRLLDEAGARERSRLSPQALDRIFAASDLQLPLAGDVSPVAGRIGVGAGASTTRLVLRAAAIAAVVCGTAVALVLATRALRTDGSDGSTVPGGTIVQDAPASEAPRVRPSPQPEHVEAALADARAGSREVAIVALADRSASALGEFEPSDDADGGAFAGILGASAFLDDARPTYDDLSGEFAALVARTGG